MSVLVMLSGGIDSTYLLARSLRETKGAVQAHHIHLVNPEGRHEAEAEACRKIVEFCRRNYRDFTYSESTVIRSGPSFGLDIMTVALEAGVVAANMSQWPQRWMVGDCAEDRSNPLDTPKRRGHIEAIMAASCFPKAPPHYQIYPVRAKRKLAGYMGPELTSLCWSCRTPVDGNPCGECKACEQVKGF